MMKRIATAILAILLAVLTAGLQPMQAVAATTPVYISEIKIFYDNAAAAEAEGYTLLKIGNDPVDLNQKAGGGLGSKGDRAVYLGYKTTTNRSEAITDLAVMNMKGGYSVKNYEDLMETQMKSQIIPLVETFLAAINEYRDNYSNGNQRAIYIHDILNKMIDDDTGMGLGDLLLNDTVYESAKPQWDALSAEEKENTTFYAVNNQVLSALPAAEKNKHADILTIIAQSNGRATLLLLNLLTRAADTNDTTWLERFSEISYDDLVDSTDMTPTDAEKELAKLYDDDANTLLGTWTSLQDELLNYDEYTAFVESYDENKLNETEAKYIALTALGADASEEEVLQALADYEEALAEQQQLLSALKAIMLHDALADLEYGDGTLLDFFTQGYEEIADDSTVLYPLAASFSEGQSAGLEYISLEELLMIALSGEDAYADADLDALTPVSIYAGVDRGIYEKDAVALTSDALRSDFSEQVEEENGLLSSWTIASWSITGVMAASAIISSVFMVRYKASANHIIKLMSRTTRTDQLMPFARQIKTVDANGNTVIKTRWLDNIYNSRASFCKWMTVGFTVAMVIIAAVSVYLTWQDLQAQYHVDYTAIPRYMIDEKDLIGYNSKGEKIILKNQSAYYKAVECNRAQDAEFYNVLSTYADLNGDVGKQWLVLYAVKKDAMEPILASSLQVVVDSASIPAGYDAGIHMFGSDVACNLNNSLYDWANDAPSVYVYFQTDDTASGTEGAGAAGATFSGGTLALTGGAGVTFGAAVTALAMKKKKPDPVEDQ